MSISKLNVVMVIIFVFRLSLIIFRKLRITRRLRSALMLIIIIDLCYCVYGTLLKIMILRPLSIMILIMRSGRSLYMVFTELSLVDLVLWRARVVNI